MQPFLKTPPKDLSLVEVDQKWMGFVLDLAQKAAEAGEIPVGAVIVKDGQVIAQAHNLKESTQNPLAHAEILAIEQASQALKAWRLAGCTLYVNLEPCGMCAGAIIQSRVERVVYGVSDPKTGAVHSVYQMLSDSRLNHQVEVSEGVMAEESRALIQKFFSELREKKRKPTSLLS